MKPYYGTVLKIQREHSLQDIERYLRDIHATGLDMVVIWPSVYWWEDRTKPGYPYNTGRAILDMAAEIGLNIIMETAGQLTALEYAPDFVMKDEYYPVKADGLRENRDDGYGFLNYFHPEVASLVEKQLVEIATAYKGYPALYGYDIFNETMYASYDRYTLQRFRDWLRAKYHTIDRLNDVWDRVYYDWSQVEFTPWLWASVMPFVDLRDFQRDAIGIQLRAWREIVRRVDPDQPTIADNLYSMLAPDTSPFRATDEWITDESVDELGMSFYPKNGVPAFAPHKRWEMLHGYTSASKDRRFWVSELQTHNQSAYRPRTTVSVQELRTWTWECFAAGCKGLIYWKWHPFIKGIQTTGRGLVDYKGRPTPRTQEVRLIADILAAGEAAFAQSLPEVPKVAILYDRMNASFIASYTYAYRHVVPASLYLDTIEGLYQCLWDEHIPAAFVRPEDILTGAAGQYPVLFVTAQLTLGEPLAKALLAYAEAGGTVIIDGKFGFIDENGIMMDAIPGGPVLQPLLQVDWLDLDSEGQDMAYTWNGQAGEMTGAYERQLLQVLEGGESQVIGTFADGNPAMVKAAVGRGTMLYMPTALWYGYGQSQPLQTRDFMRALAGTFDMRTYRYSGEAKVNVNRSEDGRVAVLYAFSYGEAEEGTLVMPMGDGVYRVTDLMRKEAQDVAAQKGQLTLTLSIPADDVIVYTIEMI